MFSYDSLEDRIPADHPLRTIRALVQPILTALSPRFDALYAPPPRCRRKGQVVIPQEIRVRLGLKAGAQFVVVGDRDVVIFKVLEPPRSR